MAAELKSWLRVSRLNFIPVSLFPYAVGALWGLRAAGFSPTAFIAGLVGAALVHAAANLFNEYWDFRLGADSLVKEYSPHYGGSRSIQEGMVAPSSVRAAGWLSLGSVLVLGFVYSLLLESVLLFSLVAGASFIAWAYTARPLSLSYRGLGEASLFMAFGPLLVCGGYYLQALRLDLSVILLSVPSGLLVTALLVVNEVADVRTDSVAGKANLAVRWGSGGASILAATCLSLAYLVPCAAVAGGIFPPAFLLILLTAPLALSAVLLLRKAVAAGTGFRKSSARMFACFSLYHFTVALAILLT